MKKISRVQLFGERCSGTNYVENLFRKNFKGVNIVWDYGWKHFFHNPINENSDDCLFLVVHRNPLDWLRSLHKNPWHVHDSLKECSISDFIRKEWYCVWDKHTGVDQHDPKFGTEMMRERDSETGMRFENVMKMRAAKIRNWSELKGEVKNYLSCRYEDVADNPKLFINQVSREFCISKRLFFKDIKSRKGNRKEAFRKADYSPLEATDRDFILANLDYTLEEIAGYTNVNK